MFGAYVRENRKVVIALAVYTAVFAFIFWLYRLPLGAVGYAALVCLFLLLVWLAVDYRSFAVRLRLLRRLEQEITLSTEQLPEPDGALEAQYQALVRALDADRRARLTRSQQGYQELVEYYTVWAHQIKTPIAAMRLLLQSPAPDPGEVGVQLTRIEQYVQMALACQRLGSPTTDYVIRRCPLEPIARAQVRQLAPLFVHKRLSLEFAIPTDVTVLTDEKWLGFVLGQLLMNALQYTREGGVRLYLEPDAPLTLVIADSGCGIRPEDLPRVFEQGYTGLGGRQNQGSTGLGLHLCRQITDRLGHSLRLESDGPGQGTRALLGLASAVLEVE